MLEYLFDTNLDVEVFGTIKKEDFDLKDNNIICPNFTGKVSCYDMINKNSESLATIIFGDKNYNNNNITLRVYESFMSKAISFIDEEFDPQHLIIDDNYFYVSSGKELQYKINELRSNYNLYKEKKLKQFEIIKNYFNNNKYIYEYIE